MANLIVTQADRDAATRYCPLCGIIKGLGPHGSCSHASLAYAFARHRLAQGAHIEALEATLREAYRVLDQIPASAFSYPLWEQKITIMKRTDELLTSAEQGNGGWQPIETAPRDGEDILALHHNRSVQLVVAWDSDEQRWGTLDGPSYHADAFTDWMPLPQPPQEKGSG